MEQDLSSALSCPDVDGLASLRDRVTSPTTWIVPAWAALCGAVASGRVDWQSSFWLRLIQLILLVDVGWGTLWSVLGSTNWTAPLLRWRDWRSGDPVARPPYALSGSPGDRASRWLGQLRVWGRDVFWPMCGLSVSVIAVGLVMTGVLAFMLGTGLSLLSIAAMALMQLGLVWEGGRGTAAPKWDAVFAVALPWLAGGLLSAGSLSMRSVGLAVAFALAWGSVRQAHVRWRRLLGVGAQFLVVLGLIVSHNALGAVCLLLLLVPQLMLFPWLQRGLDTGWAMRYTRPWMMAAMLVAAWVF
jgi:hypothetical protein